jgi:hypothetical protein
MKRSHPFWLALAFLLVSTFLVGGRVAQARALDLGAGLDPAGDPLGLEATVGTDPTICSLTQTITVPAGTAVTYCYTVTNNTSYTLTRHTLSDSYQNHVMVDQPYTLTPGASVALTRTLVVYGSQVNVAEWQATQPITGYAMSEIACNHYPDASGGTNLQLTDDGLANLTLPFAFDFYDRHSARLRVSNNGLLFFDEPDLGGLFINNFALPSSAIPHALAAFWDDWDDETGAVYAGSVSVPTSALAGSAALAGVAPQGDLEFYAVEYRGRSIYEGPSDPGSFAVLLAAPGQGADGAIIVCYKDTYFNRPLHDYGASATIGLNHNQSQAQQASFNTPQVELTGTFGLQFLPLGLHHGYVVSDAAEVHVYTTINVPLASK